ELEQVGNPQYLYDHPVNLFVAGFIGSPALNALEGPLPRSNGTLPPVAGEGRLHLHQEVAAARPGARAHEGGAAGDGDPPGAPGAPRDRRLRGTVQLREALGSEVLIHMEVGAQAALTEDVRELAADVGDDRAVTAAEDASHAMLVGRFGPRSRAQAGETIEVSVDTRSLHFFDPGTGLGIYD